MAAVRGPRSPTRSRRRWWLSAWRRWRADTRAFGPWAVACEVLRGNASHFDERTFALKPHPGQVTCARWIREDLEYRRGDPAQQTRIQDRYSLRCSPHVIGVLLDALAMFRPVI